MATTNTILEYDKGNQIEVDTLTITKSASGSTVVDISGIYEDILIYEDIFQTAISARLILRDQVSLVSSLPIVGGETINLKYRTPAYSNFVTLTFMVYKVGEREIPNSSENMQISELFLCTPEVWWAANNDMSVGYTGPYSDIVQALIKESGTTKTITAEATTGINTYVSPMWNIFNSIKWCASRANSQSLSPMFFWETVNSGYIFQSLQVMYSATPYKTLYIEDRSAQSQNTSTNKVFNTAYSFDFPSSNDKLSQFDVGAFGNDSYLLDFTNKQLTKSTNSYIDNVFTKQNIHIDKFPISDDCISIRHKTELSMKRNDHSELSDFTKRSALAIMDNTRILVAIPGDSNLQAGCIVNLDIPIKVQLSMGKDIYVSGEWMVRSIKNNIQRTTFSQVLELTKDSFATAVRPINAASTT